MSIITDIRKTVRSRIVGEGPDAAKGRAKPESVAAAPAVVEPPKSRSRQAAQRNVASDDKEQVGFTHPRVESADRGESENHVSPETRSKSDTVIHLLRRLEGATIADLMSATSWQRHSVRGFLSAKVRKKLGLTLISYAADGGERRYRIKSQTEGGVSAPADGPAPNGRPSTPTVADNSTDTAVC